MCEQAKQGITDTCTYLRPSHEHLYTPAREPLAFCGWCWGRQSAPRVGVGSAHHLQAGDAPAPPGQSDRHQQRVSVAGAVTAWVERTAVEWQQTVKVQVGAVQQLIAVRWEMLYSEECCGRSAAGCGWVPHGALHEGEGGAVPLFMLGSIQPPRACTASSLMRPGPLRHNQHMYSQCTDPHYMIA